MKLVALTLLAFTLFHQPLGCQSASKDDPPTVLWRGIKQALSGPNGREYFEQSIKDAVLPTLYGTIVSSTPADHPNTFLIAMANNSRPEVTLRLKGRLEKPLPATTPVKFSGVAIAFAKDPFMLTCDVDAVNRGTYSPGKMIKPVSPKY
jgi:hypothetical protein